MSFPQTPPPVRQIRQVFDRVVQLMSDDGFEATHYFGSEHLPEQFDAGFRYVWIPTVDTFGGPYKGGDNNPRSIYMRILGVEIHCWGAVYPPGDSNDPDVYYDAGDILAEQLCVYLRRVCLADFEPKNGAWIQAKSQTVGVFGRVYVLGCTVDVPVRDVTYSLAQINQIVLSMYARDPAGDDGDGQLEQTINIP